MGIGDLFFLLTPPHIGMHHLADDGSGANDGDLHHHVVELLWFVPRQRRHLCPALHLEHTDRVGALQSPIHIRVFGQIGEINEIAIVLGDQFDAVLQHSHHAKAQQIDFDDAEISAIFLVPLHDGAARHRSPFQRNHAIQLSLADNHAPGMLPQMARQVLNTHTEFEILCDAWMFNIETCIAEGVRHRIRRSTPFEMAYETR
jgi:hypothetical protein